MFFFPTVFEAQGALYTYIMSQFVLVPFQGTSWTCNAHVKLSHSMWLVATILDNASQGLRFFQFQYMWEWAREWVFNEAQVKVSLYLVGSKRILWPYWTIQFNQLYAQGKKVINPMV